MIEVIPKEETTCDACKFNERNWDEEPCNSCTFGGDSNYFMPASQAWIPVNERLPKGRELVNVSCHDDSGDTSYDYSSCGWVTDDGEYWIVDNEINSFVVAWIPLPKPYKEEKRFGDDPKDEIREIKRELEKLPSAQPEPYKEKLKEIANALSEKFAYMHTCLNERDIILGYLGVKHSNEIHCNTDCTNAKCESYHFNKRLPSAQSELIRCQDCKFGLGHAHNVKCDKYYGMGGYDDFCSRAERRQDEQRKTDTRL